MNANGSVVWGVAGSLPRRRRGVGVGMCFCIVPISEQDLSRYRILISGDDFDLIDFGAD
jgi:hypothetical protein